MKAGDLVTLSAYANGLDSLYKWCEGARVRMNKAPIVGLIIKARRRHGERNCFMKSDGWRRTDPEAAMGTMGAFILTVKI